MTIYDVYCYSKREIILSTSDKDEAEDEKKDHRLMTGHIVGILEREEPEDPNPPQDEEE